MKLAIIATIGMLFAGSALAADNPFLGTWKVTASQTAPWYDGDGAKPDVSELAGKTIVFEAARASGAKIVACDNVVYTVATVPPDYLFEGSLSDPKKDAAALGFKSDKILSLNEGCISSEGDLELDFPMIDNDTILLGLNNVIYTFKRVEKSPLP